MRVRIAYRCVKCFREYCVLPAKNGQKTPEIVECLVALRRARLVQQVWEVEMIKCRSTVEILRGVAPGRKGLNVYRVEVWGIEPHDFARVYEIAAKDENIAAREGLDRFVEDVSALLDQKGN